MTRTLRLKDVVYNSWAKKSPTGLSVCRALWFFHAMKEHKRKTWRKYKWTIKVEISCWIKWRAKATSTVNFYRTLFVFQNGDNRKKMIIPPQVLQPIMASPSLTDNYHLWRICRWCGKCYKPHQLRQSCTGPCKYYLLLKVAYKPFCFIFQPLLICRGYIIF